MRLFIGLICFLSIYINVFSDVVYLNKGEELDGDLVGIKDKIVEFNTKGKTEKIKFDEILRIELPKLRDIKGENSVSDIKDDFIRNIIRNAPDSSEYPDKSYITLLDYFEVNVDEKGLVSTKSRMIRKIFKEKAKSRSNASISYKVSETEKADIIFARAINGEKITYINDDSIKYSSVYPFYAEYNDMNHIRISIPKVDVGSIVDYQFETSKKKHGNMPESISYSTYFSYFEPCNNVVCKFTFPEKYKDLFYFKNVNVKDLQYKEEKKGNRIIVTMSKNNIKTLKSEKYMIPYDMYAEKAYYGLKLVDFNKQLSFVNQKIRESEKKSENTRKLTEKIVEGLETEQEKLEAIFKYVSRNIGYLNVGMPSYRYYPRDVDSVLKNMRGNAVDKYNLFRVMCKFSGIEAKLCYIRNGHYELNPEYRNLEEFSGSSVLVKVNGKWLSVDPLSTVSNLADIDTGNYYRLDLNSGNIEYIDFSKGDQYASNTVFSGKLDEKGCFEGSMVLSTKGGAGKNLRSLRYLRKEEVDRAMEGVAKQFGTKAEMISYKLENLDSIDSDTKLSIDIRIPEFAVKTGDKLFMFNIPAVEFPTYIVGASNRVHDILLRNVYNSENFIFKMELPGNFKIYSSPEDKETSLGKYISMKAKTEVKNNVFKFSFNQSFDKDILPVVDYMKYKKLIEDISLWAQQYVVVTK